ncbi:MAG TPA: thiamine-phosphate kinase [Thermoanaerobaculia bacterium]|nr:thiamine-phosphate kinase [Thermoanaerobaculia bacterium]
MSEEQLIARIRELFPPRRAVTGIGDDAAVIDVAGRQVVTCDMLIEDVDFTSAVPLPFVARKALAANLSDLAAMGAVPDYFVVALAFPRSLIPAIEGFLVALAEAARHYAVELIGGDLSGAGKLIVSVTAMGTLAEGARPLLRSGARAGDRLYVSRPIGGSAAGLALLQKGWTIHEDGTVEPPPRSGPYGYAQRELAAAAIRRHVDPEPETLLGPRLASMPEVTACLDISDGLSTDLHHLCDASGVGAEIERERLPIFSDLIGTGGSLGIRADEAVLHGGEEYALLFTSTMRESELSSRLGRPVYAIGQIKNEKRVTLKEGETANPLEARGFDHFS